MVTLWSCIRTVLGSNIGRKINYPDWSFCGPRQSLQINAGVVPRLDQGFLLSDPSQFIIHQSSYNSTLYSLDTDSNFIGSRVSRSDEGSHGFLGGGTQDGKGQIVIISLSYPLLLLLRIYLIIPSSFYISIFYSSSSLALLSSSSFLFFLSFLLFMCLFFSILFAIAQSVAYAH